MRAIVFSMMVSVALLTILVSSAHANVTEGGRFTFSSYTKNKDPINILFFGGTPRSDDDEGGCSNLNQSGRPYRTPRCFSYIARTRWKQTGVEFKPRVCNGKDTLAFRVPDGGIRYRTNDVSNSTSKTCKTQYHLRIWGDSYVNDSPLREGQFSVGMAYHETRPALKRGHKIDMSWEAAENALVRQLGRSTRGEPAQCTYSDYRPMDRQRPGKWRGWYTDGRVSKVSVQAINGSAPPGQKCRNAGF